jgi:hypothetical protein
MQLLMFAFQLQRTQRRILYQKPLGTEPGFLCTVYRGYSMLPPSFCINAQRRDHASFMTRVSLEHHITLFWTRIDDEKHEIRP